MILFQSRCAAAKNHLHSFLSQFFSDNNPPFRDPELFYSGGTGMNYGKIFAQIMSCNCLISLVPRGSRQAQLNLVRRIANSERLQQCEVMIDRMQIADA